MKRRDYINLLLCGNNVNALLKLKQKNLKAYRIVIGLMTFAGVFSVATLITSAVYMSNANKNISEFKESQEYLEEVKSQEQELNSSDMNDDERQQKLEDIYSDENALAILKNSNSPLNFQYQNNYDISMSCTAYCIVGLASMLPIIVAGKRYGDRLDSIDKKLKDYENQAIVNVDWTEIFEI